MKPSLFVAVCRWLVVLAAGIGMPALAGAQCVVSTPPANCPTPFIAIDVLTGQEVQALCLGRTVRFEPAPCRGTIDPKLLYYNANDQFSTSPTPPNCDFTPYQLANNLYTPSNARPTTISELTNSAVAGGTGTVYTRRFEVASAPLPKFTLVPCANNLARLTITGGEGFDQYFYRIANGPAVGPLTVGQPLTLAAPAGTIITVVGAYRANGLCTGQAIPAVPALLQTGPPVITSLTVLGTLPGSIRLEVSTLPEYYLYDVQIADASSPGGYRRVAPLARGSVGSGATTVTLANAPAGTYRIGKRDVCQTDSAFSAPFPTIVLRGASGGNVNKLTWQTTGTVTGYTLLRDGAALATLPPATASYNDVAVACGTRYTYRLQASTASGGTSISNEVAVQTVSAQALPPPLLNASFDLRNRLTLTASQASGAALAAGGQLRYSRQGGPGTLDFAAVPTATDTLRDPADVAALLAAPPCYTVRLQDVCGNGSAASPPTCPSLLRVEAADPEGLTARLSWSAFQGPGGAAGVSYRVLTLSPTGAVLATSAPISGLSYLDPAPPTTFQVLRYRIEASGAGLPAGTVSYSNVASLARQPRVVVPNAFTPNGDGLNDVLELKGRYLNGFTFVVVDRNGQEVFRATDRSQTWDGTIRGHAPVNAAYVWRFTLRDEAGQEISQTGTVTILK
jgi:gliding motility-associated-like protein